MVFSASNPTTMEVFMYVRHIEDATLSRARKLAGFKIFPQPVERGVEIILGSCTAWRQVQLQTLTQPVITTEPDPDHADRLIVKMIPDDAAAMIALTAGDQEMFYLVYGAPASEDEERAKQRANITEYLRKQYDALAVMHATKMPYTIARQVLATIGRMRGFKDITIPAATAAIRAINLAAIIGSDMGRLNDADAAYRACNYRALTSEFPGLFEPGVRAINHKVVLVGARSLLE